MTNIKYADDIYDSAADLMAELALPEGVHQHSMFRLDGEKRSLVYVVAIQHDGGPTEIIHEGDTWQGAHAAFMEAYHDWKIAQRRKEIAEQS